MFRSAQNLVRAFLRSLRTYLWILRRLLGDSLLRFKWDTLAILAAGLFGTLLFVGSMGQIILYARAFANNTTIDAFGWSLQPRSPENFILFVLGVFVFWTTGALLIYNSNSRIFRLAGKYESFCAQRVCLILARLNGLVSPGGWATWNSRAVNTLLSSDPRFLGRTVCRLIKLFQPGCVLLFAMASLFYINAGLTVLICLTLSISLYLHYQNNRRGAFHHRSMEETGPGRSVTIRELKSFALRKKNCPDDFRRLLEERFRSGDLASNQVHFRERFLVIEKAVLLNNLTLITLLIEVLVILGRNAFQTGVGWGSLIVYILALRYCMNQIRNISSSLTGINRFYPVFTRYFNFIEHFENPERETKPSPSRQYVTRAPEASSENIRFRPNDASVTALAVPWSFEIPHLSNYMSCLWNGRTGCTAEALRSSRVITAAHGHLNGLSIRELFNLSKEWTAEKLQTALSELGLDPGQIPQIEDLDAPCTDHTWNRLSAEAKYATAFLSALNAGTRWLFVEQPVLESLSSHLRKNLFRAFDGGHLMVLYTDGYDGIGRYGETAVAVIDGEKLIGSGSMDWFVRHRERLTEELLKAKEKPSRSPDARDDLWEDDELDMDAEMD